MKKTIVQIRETLTNEFATTREQWNSKVDESLGSLFTKDDVKNIIKNLVDDVIASMEYELDGTELLEVETSNISKDTLKEFIQRKCLSVVSEIYWSDHISATDERFSLGYDNCVSLDEYDLEVNSNRDLADEISSFLIDDIDELYVDENKVEENC